MNKWETAFLAQRRNLRKRERRIKMLKIGKEKSILDCGCGYGMDLRAFKRLGYKNVVGLDKSRDYINQLKGEFKVYQADACDTGLPSDSFDVIFIDSALHHFDVQKVLKEIKRILKVDGELCIIEPRANFARRILDFATLRPFISSFGYLKNRRISLIEERETYDNWLKQEPFLVSILEKFGFKVAFYKKLFLTTMIKCRLTNKP